MARTSLAYIHGKEYKPMRKTNNIKEATQMKPVRRVYIYEEFYQEVIQWAKNKSRIHNAKSPNGKDLNESFPASLEEYSKEMRVKKGYATTTL